MTGPNERDGVANAKEKATEISNFRFEISDSRNGNGTNSSTCKCGSLALNGNSGRQRGLRIDWNRRICSFWVGG